MRKKSKMSKASAKASDGREDHFSLIYLEKQFFNMPASIVLRSHREIEQLRKQEVKIKNGLKKIQLQAERFELKIVDLKKKNNTEAKKKIAKIRKVLQDSHKSVALLNKSLTEIESIYHAIAARNAKFAAVRKLLTHFEKEWRKIKSTARKGDASMSLKAKMKSSTADKARKVGLIKERGQSKKIKSN